MRIKCEYCGNNIEDTDKVCPHCGAPNDRMQRSASGEPKTIEELQRFCAEKGMPLEKMRFFIGEDYTEPKAFGIYKDVDGNFIVYKNKADGSRAIRYRGTDEAYAVNEIYQKLKSEISSQRARASGKGGKKSSNKILLLILAVYLLFSLMPNIIRWHRKYKTRHNGYYHYSDNYYYNQAGSWYLYDYDGNEWIPTTVDSTLTDHYSDYFESQTYSSTYSVQNFDKSSYYDANYSADWDDDDFDWDWDFGDWDSDSTDWDSDW